MRDLKVLILKNWIQLARISIALTGYVKLTKRDRKAERGTHSKV